ncbi:restriction endonuclease subunit S [Proteus vulgaris]|uniref:restriction endonuclease subunit S n=1 Tax=Proteus vulgaris TaxID=585 RepID=UPI0006588233|nr:restriction endonuclease subunit S [Proteus vulgaris]CRL60944.1 EcoKI restriction-modification system protein HsdS [Proteus vulgaris]
MEELVKVGQLCEISSSKRIFAKEYQESGIPFFRGKEVTEKFHGKLDVTTELFISEDKYLEIESKFGVPKQGDMLLTSIGTLGSTYIVKESDKFYFKDGNLTWFKNFKGLSSQYLQYWLESPEGKGQLRKSEIGSSQPAYTIANLKEMQISLPSLDDQLNVASYIRTYDSFIENNNRRIAILEDMAQSLYREWFVKFRYPSYGENLDVDGKPKLVESPLGQIPEGWKIKSLGNLVELKRETIKKGNVPENTHYMGLEHFPRKSIALSDWEDVSEIGSNKLAFTRGDILFGKIRPNFHKVGVAQVDGLCSSDTFILSPMKPAHHSLIAMVMFSNEFIAQAVQTAQGSKMPRASWDVLKDFSVCLPDSDALERFNNVVTPAIEQIRLLSLKNRNLKQQRDMLLPKLISGQIKI